MKKEKTKKKDKHRYGLMIPQKLWNKLVDEHWQQRKSINKIIIETLREKYE